MTVTAIESFLLAGRNQSDPAPFVSKLSFSQGAVTVNVVSKPGRQELATLHFANATMKSVWFDGDEAIEWPLDVIGFDSYREGESWRFVVYCSSLEFEWVSAWPSKTTSG